MTTNNGKSVLSSARRAPFFTARWPEKPQKRDTGQGIAVKFTRSPPKGNAGQVLITRVARL